MSWSLLNDYRCIKPKARAPKALMPARLPEPRPHPFGNAAWRELNRLDEEWKAART